MRKVAPGSLNLSASALPADNASRGSIMCLCACACMENLIRETF
jgi:hypothetical protein